MAMTPQTDDAVTQPPLAASDRPRHHAVLFRGAALAACALVAAACGSSTAPGSGSSGSGPASAAASTSASAASAAKVSLLVRFSGTAKVAPQQYTLRCEPAGGTVRNPAAACARLMSGTDIFAPKPAHVMCPMILADAGRASVSGVYLGRKVHETIVDGGCDLSRWAKLRQVFN